MNKTDEALIAEYLAGDEEAFSLLVKRHLKTVYSFAARSVKSDAEDITQEVFLKVWRNLGNYDSRDAKFKTWLMRIARNTVIDALRKRKPFAFSDLERDGEDTFGDTPDLEPLPDEIVARAHDERAIEAALAQTPPLYREIVLLHYMSGLTFHEIGQILDVPPNTARSRHRRALAHLRRNLEAMHQNPH
jgi:RNA polymerase sigma-70 factor, ECF subfamily